jgi:hypothetical protein
MSNSIQTNLRTSTHRSRLHLMRLFFVMLLMAAVSLAPQSPNLSAAAQPAGSLLTSAPNSASGVVADKPEQTDQMRPPAVRGQADDWWADTVLGKPDFASIAPNTATAHALFWSAGVVVDKTGWPAQHNKLYIYDGGNNRILGIGDLQVCRSAPTTCQANLVIGQPNFSATGCNRDTGFQRYPVRALSSASMLCTQPESVQSPAESGSGASMDVDTQGSLFVADYFNHRVLKYSNPFSSDTVADDVWGQPDMQSNYCNRTAPGGPIPNPMIDTLCFDWGHSNNAIAGVDIDIDGNLWVADTGNNRVLRFPANSQGVISHTPDVVFGQEDFTSRVRRTSENDPNRFADVAAVRVSDQGWVYTTETGNDARNVPPDDNDLDRVMVFTPTNTTRPYQYQQTFQSGHFFKRQAGTDKFRQPSGIEFKTTSGISRTPGVWILNSGRGLAERWSETVDPVTGEHQLLETIGNPNNWYVLGGAAGSFGIDSEGYRYILGSAYGAHNRHQVMIFPNTPNPIAPSAAIFVRNDSGNEVTNYSMFSGTGVAVVGNQVIAADDTRLLFWNDRNNLQNGQTADGVVSLSGSALGIMADQANHLYVALARANGPEILVYTTTLTNFSQPLPTNLKFPFYLINNEGTLSPSTGAFYGVQPSANGDFLWIGQKEASRVFRVRNPLTNPQVDIVLGQTDPYGQSRNRQPVTFTQTVGVTVTGNSIQKTGAGGNWDAGAISDKSFVTDGSVSMKIQNSGVAFGLNHDNLNASYTDLDYGFIVDSGGQLKIYDQGAVVLTTTYSIGDVLTVQIEDNGFWTNYLRNSTSLLRIGRDFQHLPAFPLFFDSSIRDSQATISDARIGGVWIPMLDTTLNFPGAVALDRKGNLYVSDHSTEQNGNFRLLEFNENLFPTNNTSVIYAPAASKVFPNIGTWQPAFDSENHMVVGFNKYQELVGPDPINLPDPANNIRFPGIYLDPLATGFTRPDSFLYDLHSMAFAATFDSDDNLYVTDTMRGRVLVYKHPRFGRTVRWKDPVNVTITANSLEKTGGQQNTWDADAISDQMLLWGDGYVEAKVDATNVARHFGFNHVNNSRSWIDIDFSISMGAGGTLAIYEYGSWRTDAGPYSVGDILKVAIEGGVVKYYRTHAGVTTLLYTSNLSPLYPLFVDTSFFNLNAKVTAAQIAGLNRGNVKWTGASNVTITGNTIEKTSGINNVEDATAVSDRTIQSGEGYVQITVDATNTDRYFGLGSGGSSPAHTDITYGLHLAPTAALQVCEGYAQCINVGTYSVGDVLKIEIQSGKVNYYRNSRFLLQSTLTPTYPLKLDTSILTMNGKITKAIISGNNLGDVTWKSLTGVTPYGNTIGKTGGAQLQWDAGAISDRSITTGTGYVEMTVDRCDWLNYNEARHFGLNNVNGNASYTDIDFSISLEAGCTFAVYENGTWKYNGGAYVAGDLFKVAVEAGGVKYYRNSTLFYSSQTAPTYPLFVDTSIRTIGSLITNVFLYGDDITK